MINKKKLQPGRDAIQRYLDEISDAPLMTDAEEQELALRIAQGDRRAADKLATANLRYVVTMAHQYLNSLPPTLVTQRSAILDDLISEGNIGLLKAATKYKQEKEHKRFVTFAAPYIRETIERFIQRCTANSQPTAYNAKRTPLHVLSTDESLPVGSNNNFTLLNVLEDKDATQADAQMEQDSLTQEMLSAISVLDERERAVIVLLYGIGTTRMTMADAGRSLDLKRERVRQIRDKALRKLRKASKIDSPRNTMNT